MSKPQDLVQGTLDLLLLKILALEPMNGHAISQRLRQMSGDVLQVSDGPVSSASQARAGGLGYGHVADDREQPPREVLRAQPSRPPSPREGSRELGQAFFGDHSGRQPPFCVRLSYAP